MRGKLGAVNGSAEPLDCVCECWIMDWTTMAPPEGSPDLGSRCASRTPLFVTVPLPSIRETLDSLPRSPDSPRTAIRRTTLRDPPHAEPPRWRAPSARPPQA
jgi:hypothetical protein